MCVHLCALEIMGICVLQYLWVKHLGGCQGHLLNVSLDFAVRQTVSGYCCCLSMW